MRELSTGQRLSVRVTPRARRARAEKVGPGLWRVWVTAPPEGGRANAAALEVLASALGVPKSRLALVQGASARDKVIEVL